MEVRACVGGTLGRGAPFVCKCGRVWWWWGEEEALLFPSAGGKQCPRRVFYGSCWTLVSFVPHLEPRSCCCCCAFTPTQATHHASAPASPLSTVNPPPRQPPNIPHGRLCNKSIKRSTRTCRRVRVCIKYYIPVNKVVSKNSH